MSELTPKRQRRRARRNAPASSSPPQIICPRCAGPVIPGQHVAPLFSATLVQCRAPGSVKVQVPVTER